MHQSLSLLPFLSQPSSYCITSMLSSFTSSLRPFFSLATRALSTSTTARQQPNYSEVSIWLSHPIPYSPTHTPANSILKPTFLQDGSEQVFRPSNVQSKRMDDVGTRSIFTPEQVKLNVSGFGKKWRHLNPCSGHVQGVSQEVHAGYPCTSTGAIETCT